MIETLEVPTTHGTVAEKLAASYAETLELAGWTVEITKNRYEGHFDADGTMWASEQLHVTLKASREDDGFLVVSWTSDLQWPEDKEPINRRNLAYRHPADVLAETQVLTTQREFWHEIQRMAR